MVMTLLSQLVCVFFLATVGVELCCGDINIAMGLVEDIYCAPLVTVVDLFTV